MSGAGQPVCLDLDPHEQAGALAHALDGKGFTTILLTKNGHRMHPCVLVGSGRERHARVAECIYAAPEDGQWWFWWSSLERIAPVSEIGITADKVTCALTCSCGMCGQRG